MRALVRELHERHTSVHERSGENFFLAKRPMCGWRPPPAGGVRGADGGAGRLNGLQTYELTCERSYERYTSVIRAFTRDRRKIQPHFFSCRAANVRLAAAAGRLGAYAGRMEARGLSGWCRGQGGRILLRRGG